MRFCKAKLSFGLPCILIGIILWLSMHWLTDQVLNQAYSLDKGLNADLDANSQAQLALVVPVHSIAIDSEEDAVVEVTLSVLHPSLKRLEFEFSSRDRDRDQAKAGWADELRSESRELERLIQSQTSNRASHAEQY